MPDDSSKPETPVSIVTPTDNAPTSERPTRGPHNTPGLSRADIDAVLRKQPSVQRVVKIVEPIESVVETNTGDSKELAEVEKTEPSKELMKVDKDKEANGKEEEEEKEEKKERKTVSFAPQPQQIPQIVTYPEHLLPPPPPPPPPLITPQTLASAAYSAGAVTLALYGANTFLVQPLLAQLNAARSSLFDTTLTNLTKMNGKLSALTPIAPITTDSTDLSTIEVETETKSSRGIQTDEHPPTSDDPSDPEAPLDALNIQLGSLVDVAAPPNPDRELLASLDDLSTYLEGLRYMAPPTLGAPAEEDDFAKVKAEIRGVKGVLLNSRNFPTGR